MASKRVPTDNTGPWGPVFYTCLAASLIGFGLFFDRASTVAVTSHDAIEVLKNELTREQESVVYVFAEGARVLKAFSMNKPQEGRLTKMAQSIP